MKTTTETPGHEFPALCRQAWDTLIPARAGYLADVSPHYDEVLHDVAQRTEHTGSSARRTSQPSSSGNGSPRKPAG